MFKSKKIIALIPARGGSKGLPKKNILPLLGKPLIAWTIEQALLSKYIDKILVSTDDEKIAQISRKYGAEVPFIRPNKIATDKATGMQVVFHALKWLEKHNECYDLIILLQPTSPLRVNKDIDKAVQLLFTKNARAIVSVCETYHHPWWSNRLPKDLNMKSFISPEILNKRRQDLPVFYQLNGAIYLADTNYLHQYNGFFGPNTFAYKMPKERSIDIDLDVDFKLAALLLEDKNE